MAKKSLPKPWMLGVAAATILIGSALGGVWHTSAIAADTAKETAAVEESALALKPTIISAEDLQAMQKEYKDLKLFDARAAKDYAAGHIPSAVNLRPDEITAAKMATLAPDKEAHLVFYCAGTHCPASEKAAHAAIKLGYKAVYEYSAGIEDWESKKLDVAK